MRTRALGYKFIYRNIAPLVLFSYFEKGYKCARDITAARSLMVMMQTTSVYVYNIYIDACAWLTRVRSAVRDR